MFAFISAKAQFNIGATVGVQIPSGSFGDGVKTGFGFNVLAKYIIKEHLALGVDLGYYGFGAKDVGVEGVKASAKAIPITALVEFIIGTGKTKPYIGADVGLFSLGAKASAQGISVSASKSYFGLAPTGGVMIGLGDRMSLCANAKYNIVFSEGGNTSWIGINAGLIFKLK
jgi:hypothetical protein